MRKVLIADDDSACRELLREVLESWGYQVIEAEDGSQVLQKTLESRPELLLLDIQMPVLDGHAIVRRIRQEARLNALPVLAVTGDCMRADREKGLASGFDAYVTKPMDLTSLRKKLQELLDRSSVKRKANFFAEVPNGKQYS